MSSSYERGGSVSPGASREHIERALAGYGATDVLFSHLGKLSAIAFKGDGRQYRLIVSPPQPDGTPSLPDDTAKGPLREAGAKTFEDATRRFWYTLAMAIEAKLAAAAAGAATLESEFLAHVVLPGNRTVLDELEPIIDTAYRSGLHPSFGDSAPPLPAAGPRPSTHATHRDAIPEPSIPAPAQPLPLQNLSARGVGRVLHNMARILDDHEHFTRRQMLEIIDHELWRDQRGEGPAAHHLNH
jgi:hypothetical protein